MLAVRDADDLGARACDLVAIVPSRVVAEIISTGCVVQRVAVGIEDDRVSIIWARVPIPLRPGSNVGEVEKPDADFTRGAGVCDSDWEGKKGQHDAGELHSSGCLVL